MGSPHNDKNMPQAHGSSDLFLNSPKGTPKPGQGKRTGALPSGEKKKKKKSNLGRERTSNAAFRHSEGRSVEEPKSGKSFDPKVPPLKISLGSTSGAEKVSKASKAGERQTSHIPSRRKSSSDEYEPPSSLSHSVESEDRTKRVLRSRRPEGSSRMSTSCYIFPDDDLSPQKGSSTSTTTSSTTPRRSLMEEKSSDDRNELVTNMSHMKLHPRKRKIFPKENSATLPQGRNNTSIISTSSNVPDFSIASTSVTSSYNSASTSAEPGPSESKPVQFDPDIHNGMQQFWNIRERANMKLKELYQVMPKPPQGFNEYLLVRGAYLLQKYVSDPSKVPQPNLTPPPTLPVALNDLYVDQELQRHKMCLQHRVEKEKLILSVEQEIIRVHTQAARELANQTVPFSACTILRLKEIYSDVSRELMQEPSNSRTRYNGRVFLSWLQALDDKWEKIKEETLARQRLEAEGFRAFQIMEWICQIQENNLCDIDENAPVDPTHVPMVSVTDDFDLLPA